MVLHEAEPSCHPLRRRPHLGESEKLVGEAKQCDMEQVRVLLDLIKGMKTNGGLVVMSFIVRRIQPYKERAHVGYDFKGDTDGTRERTEMLSTDDVLEQAVELFTLFASFSMSGQVRPFNSTNPPPQVNISTVCS